MSSGDLLDEQICFPLYASSRAVNRLYVDLLAPSGLTYPQYLVMLVLWEEQSLPMSRIGERLALDSGTLTPLLKRLEHSGLVERTRDPADERRVLVRITDAGRDLRAGVADVPDRARAATGLTDEQVDTLRDLLTQVLHHVTTRPDHTD